MSTFISQLYFRQCTIFKLYNAWLHRCLIIMNIYYLESGSVAFLDDVAFIVKLKTL
jgi:hypothetical protein